MPTAADLWLRFPWAELRDAACSMATHANAPYSRARVGAADITERGHHRGGAARTGCNVEHRLDGNGKEHPANPRRARGLDCVRGLELDGTDLT